MINSLIVFYRLFSIAGFLIRSFFKSFYKTFRSIIINNKILLLFFIYFKRILEYLLSNFFYSFIEINASLL